ncbi:hypothetical protein C0989_010703 [Termitomyces sp. Mn162]|nr:hypothetical protein C0989_010703 [Termitomyces sp. Mn162]
MEDFFRTWSSQPSGNDGEDVVMRDTDQDPDVQLQELQKCMKEFRSRIEKNRWLHLRDSEDEAEYIQSHQVGSGSRKWAEQGIHQPSDAGQVQQDQDEMTYIVGKEPIISGPESDSHVKELSDSGDFDEPMVDDIEEDNQTAAATCAHAQTILDACNGTQDASHADTEGTE